MAPTSRRRSSPGPPGPPPAEAPGTAGETGFERLEEIEKALDHAFHDRSMLMQALTHSSLKDETHPSNETLEFLGDSILGMVIADHLFRKLPRASEGDLTRIKSVVVSRSSLSKLAKKLEIASYLAVGKGIRQRRSLPPSIAANAIEALIAALYLDGGLEVASRFILEHFCPLVRTVTRNRHAKNYKSLLQHLSQRQLGVTPEYEVLDTTGPDHLKTFEVSARIGERQFPPARGQTKKAAEQRAAHHALKILREEYGKDA